MAERGYQYLTVFARREVVKHRLVEYFRSLVMYTPEQTKKVWYKDLPYYRGDFEGFVFGTKILTCQGLPELADFNANFARLTGCESFVYFDSFDRVKYSALYDPIGVRRFTGMRPTRRDIVSIVSEDSSNNGYDVTKLLGLMLGYPREAVEAFTRERKRYYTRENYRRRGLTYKCNPWMTFNNLSLGKYKKMEEELVDYIGSFGLDASLFLGSDEKMYEDYCREIENWLATNG